MKLRSLRNDDTASLSYFLVFVYLGTILIFLFAVGIPFLISFNSGMYTAGSDIIADASEKIGDIENAEVKTRIQSTLTNAQSSTENTIDLLSFFFQYSWVWIMLIITFTIFIVARKNVEANQLGVV